MNESEKGASAVLSVEKRKKMMICSCPGAEEEVLAPGWNMMFPAVSGNLKSVPCLKAIQSLLSDTRRAPVPVLILV